MNDEKNIPLKMVRENLEDIPQFAMPENFSLRWFQPGDEKIWREIQSAADKFNDITPELFQRQFAGGAERGLQAASPDGCRSGINSALLSERQCYLLDAHGNAIGTATAWFNNNFEGARIGRVHWVAILPEHQGKGLSKPLMTATCNRLRELGHTRTYLSTSIARIPAIRLYLRFGFEPVNRNVEDAAAWKTLRAPAKK